MVLYVSDYITKSTLKTHTIFESIKSVFYKNSEMINGDLPMKEKTRRLMTKVVNLLSAKMEMGAPMICMYLLGNPDHYTDHEFVPFYWQSYVNETRKVFMSEDESEPTNVILFKRRGAIVGLSPVFDYIYCSELLKHVSLYDWIIQYEQIKLQSNKSKTNNKADVFDNDWNNKSNISIDSLNSDNLLSEENSLLYEDMDLIENVDLLFKTPKNVFHFQNGHPLFQSHAMKFKPKHEKIVPNFAKM